MASQLIAEPCQLWNYFDMSIVARSYQQVAGILAGFAFVAINLIIDRRQRDRAAAAATEAHEGHQTITGIAMVIGFIGLVLTAIQYSLLTGEQGCALTGGRAASKEVLGGVAFGASIYILLYAMVQYLSDAAASLSKHGRFIVAVLVPPTIVFFVQATLMDLAVALGSSEARQPLQSLWDWAHRLSIPVAVLIFSACGGVWYFGMSRRRSKPGTSKMGQTLRIILPYVTLALVTAALMRSGLVLPNTNPGAHISPLEAWAWVTILAAVLLIQSIALSTQKGIESPRSRPTQEGAA
ncbi:MAG TPA: hypothetical protein VFR27_18775 [Mycobacterium sp.]|nr:hypothetical protein [Mycobacterium sp.]